MISRRLLWLVPALALVSAITVSARERGDWTVLHDCRLIDNPANDGDSIHVSAGEKEYIFRLYLVDAPETAETQPGRLVEQAKYFGITVPQAIEVGRAATEFTRERLTESFTVFTRLSTAMGRSRSERFYAFVQTKDGDLGEQLVRNGLARVHGTKIVPPGLSSAREEEERLLQHEDEAKQEKIGAWGITADRLKVRAEKVGKPFSFFAVEPSAGGTSAMAAGESPPSDKLDINTATAEQLQSVPGIGPVTAARIVAARPFQSADDLKRVSGVGDKKYTQLRAYFR